MRCSALSRIEQVLIRITSAPAGSSVYRKPSPLQDRKHNFTVAGVHLATVRFDIKLAPVTHNRTQAADIYMVQIHLKNALR